MQDKLPHILTIADLSASNVVMLLKHAWQLQLASSLQENTGLSNSEIFIKSINKAGELPLDENSAQKLFAGKKIMIVGDILHSRVARSNLELINKLGGQVVFVAPPTLIPSDITELACVEIEYDFDKALQRADFDAIMLLRIQAERMLGGAPGPTGSASAGFFPSLEDYQVRYCLTNERAELLSPNIPVLHPAPINRGLDIASKVADSPRSLINHQIRNGVFLRMSALANLIGSVPQFNSINDYQNTEINQILKGKTIVNLFFENSTRTRFSFDAAMKRLGATSMNFSASGSSVGKGESLKDTIMTLYAMGIDGVVIRHQDSGAPYRLAHSGWVDVPVINAGDGMHAHPTQALLDALTLLQHFSGFSALHCLSNAINDSQIGSIIDNYGRII